MDHVKQELIQYYSSTQATLEKLFLGSDIAVGSEAFFRQSEHVRTQLYPYLESLVGFDQWRGRRVLEIGTGMGVDHVRFARHEAKLSGIDLTPLHLHVTAARLAAEGYTPCLTRADAEHLPFPDAAFDHVYSCGVLFLIPNIQRAVDEIYRVIRPGGQVLAMLYHQGSLHYYLKTLAFTGVVWGDLLYMSRQRLVDWSADGLNYPIIRLFTRAQARRLFRKFSRVECTVRTLTAAEFPVIGHRLPPDFLEFLSRRFGFFLFVRAWR